MMRQPISTVLLTTSGLLFSLSCTPAFTARRLDDGSYQLHCNATLSQCLARVDDICGGAPYEVLSASDHRKTTDIAVGGVQNEIRSSEAILRCVHNRPLFGGGAEPQAPIPSPIPVEAPPTVVPPPRACIPGATQACVGLGACAGGQACLPDGAGFGPCDCGPPGPSADAGVH